MNDQQAIEKYKQLAEKNMKPSDLEHWSSKADQLAIESKKSMVVVQIGKGVYAIYPKAVADKWGREYEYLSEYVGEAE